MAVFQRGNVWWYEFTFRGQRVRESTGSTSKTLAIKAERQRRRELEESANHLKPDKRPQTFTVYAKEYLDANRAHWTASNLRIETYNVRHLEKTFGKLLLVDISAPHIAKYQAARLAEKASPRTVNMEVGTLRAILRKHRLWTAIQPDVKPLRVKNDIGRALSDDEEHRLLVACRKSRSRSLYPAALLALHSGLRNRELRLLRWRQVDMLEGLVTVGESKTEGGEGRIVPMSEPLWAAMKEWRSQFSDAKPGDFVFPSERYGFDGEAGHLQGAAAPYNTRPGVPMGSWKTAWQTAKRAAGVTCRWHDLRHSFISRLAEGQTSDATIMSLAGHLSLKMKERYSHTRMEAKRQAVKILDSRRLSNEGEVPTIETGYPQIPPQ
jgi:integrase